MLYDNNNIFAKILRNEITCEEVYNSDYALAFHDKFPKAPIHILVIPKGTYKDAFDFHNNASQTEIIAFYKATAYIVDKYNLYNDGFRMVSNCGKNAKQEIPHYHVHILGGTILNTCL
ncbi:MAG: HIT domain-containing protein [Alphaproteobacteria bacterium]